VGGTTQGGGDIRQAEMWWQGINGFGLKIEDEVGGDANYYFQSQNLYLDNALFGTPAMTALVQLLTQICLTVMNHPIMRRR